MNSRLDKNNNGKIHKRIIIISIIAILFVIMLVITVASLSIAGKLSIEAESAKQSKQSKKIRSSSQTSSEKSVSISRTNVSSDVSSTTESVNKYGVTSDEQSMFEIRLRIAGAVSKAMYYDAGDDTPKLDHFEEIPGGFKIYFVDGMSYKVRDTGFARNLASLYDFGNNHGFEIYFDDKPSVGLEVPQMGGVYDITPDMLKQYAIR
ncbi:hypothetical protein [Weissella kandleri]|nr:hypothetical protein [Weissella kandleri]